MKLIKKLKEWRRAHQYACMSEFGRALFDALQEPEDWEQSEHYTTHSASGMVMWTANGPHSFHPYVEGDLDKFRNVYPAWEKKVCWSQLPDRCGDNANRALANRLILSKMKGGT